MGRHLNLVAKLAVFGTSTLFYSGTGLSASAQARTPAGQVYPAISLNTPLARDADTFEGDKRLDLACRKTGQEKAVCLCITHIMKYELTLGEYRAATRLYGQGESRTALHIKLRTEGFKPSEIRTAEQMERAILDEGDFALRCADAKAYYRPQPKKR